MPVYAVSTPNGERVIEAKTQRDAIEHCVNEQYVAAPLSPVQLAEKVREGRIIEQTQAAKEAASLKSNDQVDIEEKLGHEPEASGELPSHFDDGELDDESEAA